MRHEKEWDKEYKTGNLVTGGDKPQAVVLRFLKWLKKKRGMNVSDGGFSVLDLGSGTGRNANYLAELGNSVVGIELSKTAIEMAKKRAKKLKISDNTPGYPRTASLVPASQFTSLLRTPESDNPKYLHTSFGEKYPFDNKNFDLILDITSSNSLNKQEREVYLSESVRVLKTDGYMLIRALCKDGDKNAKRLIQNFPGKEKDTYILPDVGITERVFTKEDITKLYSKHFRILEIKKESHYVRMQNRVFKRNYWIVYLTNSKK